MSPCETENEINDIEEMKLAANEKIDKTENKINEIEEMKLAANKEIDKTENVINEIEEIKFAAHTLCSSRLSQPMSSFTIKALKPFTNGWNLHPAQRLRLKHFTVKMT